MMVVLMIGVMLLNSLMLVGIHEQSRKDSVEREEHLTVTLKNLAVVLHENSQALLENARVMEKIQRELGEVKQDVQAIKNILEDNKE